LIFKDTDPKITVDPMVEFLWVTVEVWATTGEVLVTTIDDKAETVKTFQ